MSSAELAALISAAGAFGAPLVAWAAIVAGNRANARQQEAQRQASERSLALAMDQIALAREERTAAHRASMFDARLRLVESVLDSASLCVAFARVHRNGLRPGAVDDDRTRRAKREEEARNRAALQESRQTLYSRSSFVLATMPTEFATAYRSFGTALDRLASATELEPAREAFRELVALRTRLIETAREALHVDVLDPRLLAAFQSEQGGTQGESDPRDALRGIDAALKGPEARLDQGA